MTKKKESEKVTHTCDCGNHHVTLKEFNRMSPFLKGYTVHMQAEHPGSELKGQENPYLKSTPQWEYWNDGERAAVLEVQDKEE
jgi:hypothetical protein